MQPGTPQTAHPTNQLTHLKSLHAQSSHSPTTVTILELVLTFVPTQTKPFTVIKPTMHPNQFLFTVATKQNLNNLISQNNNAPRPYVSFPTNLKFPLLQLKKSKTTTTNFHALTVGDPHTLVVKNLRTTLITHDGELLLNHGTKIIGNNIQIFSGPINISQVNA